MAGQTADGRDLRAGMRLRGLTSRDVEVVAVIDNGGYSVTVVFRDDDGGLGSRVLTPAELSSVLVLDGARWTFDGDPAAFVSAMEAQRIRSAGRDLAIVDEAHRMSANRCGGELE
jgi:hypothetical protein